MSIGRCGGLTAAEREGEGEELEGRQRQGRRRLRDVSRVDQPNGEEDGSKYPSCWATGFEDRGEQRREEERHATRSPDLDCNCLRAAGLLTGRLVERPNYNGDLVRV